MDKQKRIKEMFENDKYSLRQIPIVLKADYSGVYLHKEGRNQDILQLLENKSSSFWKCNIIAPKLKFNGYGNYEFLISLIGIQYFDSHEQLDTLYARDRRLFEYDCIKKNKISLKDALDLWGLKMSCDMDFYLTNRDEMEKDLGRSSTGLGLSWACGLINNDYNNRHYKDVLKQLQDELLHNEIIEIFGDGDDGEIVFEDYHMLYKDGNFGDATARRGNYYWIIQFGTS